MEEQPNTPTKKPSNPKRPYSDEEILVGTLLWDIYGRHTMGFNDASVMVRKRYLNNARCILSNVLSFREDHHRDEKTLLDGSSNEGFVKGGDEK